MNAFKIHRHADAESIETNLAGMFRLLITDSDFEIFEAEINASRSIICQPYESKDAMNACYVIFGKLYHSNSDAYIGPGEYYTFKNLKETHYLRVEEKTKLIMIRKNGLFKVQLPTMNKVLTMMETIQEKDHYTEDHCNRVGNLSVEIGTFLGLEGQLIENLLFAAKIHDLGKVEIPNEILNKPSKLSHEEFNIMKKHPEKGREIVSKVTGNQALAEIVYQHHERLDGSGYPLGLKGDAIRIEAKIIAVVDAYDAMVKDRPYRKAMTNEAAMAELKKCQGQKYDPKIVGVLEIILNGC